MPGEGEPGPERDAYLLGTGDPEVARLGFQHRVWAAEAFALWRRAGFRRGDRLADLGCGPGHATLDLAQLVGPEGRVVGVDRSARFLDALRRRAAAEGVSQVETVHAEIERAPFTDGSLDGAYARWLFCFLADPEAVVRRLAAWLRPGGVLAATDYFNYRAFRLAPASEPFARVVAAVQESWWRTGGDLDRLGRLPGWLVRHGFELRDVRPIVRVARPGTPAWAWPDSFFRGYLPQLEADGLVDAATREAFWADWDARAGDPGAFLFLPPLLDVVARTRGRSASR